MKTNLLVFVLLCFVRALAHQGHKCMFSELYSHSNHYVSTPQPIHQQLKSVNEKRNLQVVGQQPMRIHLNTDHLNSVKASENGVSQTTITNLNYLKKSIQVARTFFEKRLSVIPESNIKSPSSCTDDYTPPAVDVSTGINTDLIVYISYLTSSSSAKGYGATGVSCSWLPDVINYPDTSFKAHRPVVGRMIYNTYNLIDRQKSITNRVFSSITATSIHQFMHILGFDQSLYQYYMDTDPNNFGQLHTNYIQSVALNPSRTGGANYMLKTPYVKQWALQHFGCSSSIGMSLQNQEGSGNPYPSHWQRLSIYDQLMTGTSMGTQKSFTGLTFALLRDMGWYGVDSSFNDSTNYGQGEGCDFFNDACYGSTQFPKYFCNQDNYVNVTQCSSTFLGKAGCTAQPAVMSDGCGMFLDYWSCVDPDQPDYGYQQVSLQQYSIKSFCVVGTLMSGGVSDQYRGRCYPYTCDLVNQKILFTVAEYSVTCFAMDAGIKKTVSGLTGYLECPNFDDFCNKARKICPNWCSKQGFCTGGICNCYITDTVAYSGEDCSISTCSESQFYNPVTKTCVSVCPDGRYGNKFSRTCMPCSGCSKCRDEPHICTGCASIGGVTYYFVNETSQCVTQCPDGTYLNGEYCENCDATVFCKTCVGSDNLCTSCINSDPPSAPIYYLYNPTSGTCNLNCPDSTYTLQDTVNLVCQQTCPNYLIQSSGKCLSCKPDYKNVNDSVSNTCITSCPPGYYANDQKYSCEPCQNTCEECEGPYAENCTKCKTTGVYLYLHLSMCLEQCLSGYYENGTSGKCEICPASQNCYTCYLDTNDGNVYCKTCIYGYFLQANQSCTSGCDSHQYSNTWNQSCDDCHNNCKDCTSPTASSCLNCLSPKYLLKNSSGSYCVSTCPAVGYVTFLAIQCEPCHKTCKSCIGLTSSDCTECSGNLYLQGGVCRYVCSPGKFTNQQTKLCQNCDSKCSFCFGNTVDNCSKCVQPYVLDNSTCTDKCPQGQSANQYNICLMTEVTTTHQLNIKYLYGIALLLIMLALK